MCYHRHGCDVIWTRGLPPLCGGCGFPLWSLLHSAPVRPQLRLLLCFRRGEGGKLEVRGQNPPQLCIPPTASLLQAEQCSFIATSWSGSIQSTLSPLSVDGGGLIHFEDLSNYGCVMSVHLRAGALKRPEASDPRSWSFRLL